MPVAAQSERPQSSRPEAADIHELRTAIEYLASIDRASCSEGEHEAAQWIAAALRDLGAEATVEPERAHGTYWWPLGITAGMGIGAAIAALRGRRRTGTIVAGLASAAVVDELGAGRRVLRSILPKRVTANVVARIGDRDAPSTVVVVAHHDAAHTSVFFDPRISAYLEQRLAPAPEKPPGLPPIMAPIAGGPALVAVASALGLKRLVRLGAWTCAGIIASFTEIALRRTVPGANDNLTGVATLLALARAFKNHPAADLQVLLVSTGAEESLMEGMRAFARRHFRDLSPDRTHVLCVDSVGSPHLVLAEAEGMLQMRSYDADFNALIRAAADEHGIALEPSLRIRLGTDGLIALRHGFRAAMLTSIGEYGVPSNYHWPTDTPDRVDYARLKDAVTLCEAAIRRLAAN